jgi:hypothetical protein
MESNLIQPNPTKKNSDAAASAVTCHTPAFVPVVVLRPIQLVAPQRSEGESPAKRWGGGTGSARRMRANLAGSGVRVSVWTAASSAPLWSVRPLVAIRLVPGPKVLGGRVAPQLGGGGTPHAELRTPTSLPCASHGKLRYIELYKGKLNHRKKYEPNPKPQICPERRCRPTFQVSGFKSQVCSRRRLLAARRGYLSQSRILHPASGPRIPHLASRSTRL